MIMLPEVIVEWGSTRLTLALMQLAILAIAFYIAFYIGPRLASSSSMFFVLPRPGKKPQQLWVEAPTPIPPACQNLNFSHASGKHHVGPSW